MNLDQVVQLVNWLDEEHRRDKTQIGELQTQIGQQYTQIQALNKNLQDLEERLARVQSQALRYSQVEQAVGQVKTEVQIAIDQYDKQRVRAEEDTFKLRQLEREREATNQPRPVLVGEPGHRSPGHPGGVDHHDRERP